jgi:hypothetical protein
VELAALVENLRSPAILLFGLGLLGAAVRSDLEFPAAFSKSLALFLLLAIGLKGGVALQDVGADDVGPVVLLLVVAVAGSALVPLAAYPVLRAKLSRVDAAAIAACYGSVSAVTFVTAIAFLDRQAVAYGGYMVAALALMESPAIIVGVLLAKRGAGLRVKPLLHEAMLGGPVVLLLGGMVVGVLATPASSANLAMPMSKAFDVALAVFLLDMGLLAGRQMRALRDGGWLSPVFALVAPPVLATVGIGSAWLMGLSPGDALLLSILFGGASYIAVPAAMRLTLPEANPGLYVPMTLGLTFSFNVTLGIPLYWLIVSALW